MKERTNTINTSIRTMASTSGKEWEIRRLLAVSDDQAYTVGAGQSRQRTRTSRVGKGEAESVTKGKGRDGSEGVTTKIMMRGSEGEKAVHA